MSFKIKIPASTANLGPGFDVLGLGLGMYLSLEVSDSDILKLSYTGNSPETVSLDPSKNLITRIAIYVANAHNKCLPPLDIHIDNPIPLGRGLGSSGSAVIAGVALANEACKLALKKNDMLDYATLIEGHPDNVAASLLGGLVTSYVRADISDMVSKLNEDESCYIPGSQVPSLPRFLNSSAGFLTTFAKLSISQKIRAVVVIPQFQVPTKLARQALPQNYSRSDVVFNLQRVSILTHALCSQKLDPQIISECMEDKVHHPYRQKLVPGLSQILALNSSALPGLLGVCLSGAGPTVLALATSGFEKIGEKIQSIFSNSSLEDGSGIVSDFMVLDIDFHGLRVEYS